MTDLIQKLTERANDAEDSCHLPGAQASLRVETKDILALISIVETYEKALLELDASAAAALETMECRMDEDCDHCVLLQSIESSATALSEARKLRGE